MIKFLSILASAFAMVSAGAAQAETYSFTFSGANYKNMSDVVTGTGIFTTTNAINQFGGYDIIGLTGTVDGSTILGIDPETRLNPAWNPYYSNASFIYDNTLFPDNSANPQSYTLSSGGVAFFTSSGDFNLGGTGVTTPSAFLALVPTGASPQNTIGFEGNVTIARIASATPELSSWMLMIIGFAITGSMLRRQRHLNIFKTASLIVPFRLLHA